MTTCLSRPLGPASPAHPPSEPIVSEGEDEIEILFPQGAGIALASKGHVSPQYLDLLLRLPEEEISLIRRMDYGYLQVMDRMERRRLSRRGIVDHPFNRRRITRYNLQVVDRIEGTSGARRLTPRK